MSGVQFLAALSKLPPGITIGQVADIAALVVEWAKARQECTRLSYDRPPEAIFQFYEAYLARFDLERRLAASVGLPAIGDAPDATGSAHEP